MRIDTRSAQCTVTYDDTKTSPEALSKILGEKGYPVQGKPKMIQ